MSTPKIYRAVLHAIEPFLRPGATHLDVGAGRGELIREVARNHRVWSYACDFHVERFAAGIPCASVNLNREPLPYDDESFDVITSSEVVEHLENYRALLKETHRVAREGAVIVVTTPNVLNLSSRVRVLLTGFANLFGPLPVRNERLYSTSGHITPIPFFYLAHALLDAGFGEVVLEIDKTQRSSAILACVLWPLLALARLRFMHRERSRFCTITSGNERLVQLHFSWRLLVGRTIIVSARKLAGRPG